MARLLATARAAAAAPGATAEEVLWAVWRASGLADRWRGDRPRRPGPRRGRTGPRWRAEAADRDLDAMVVLFDAAARFVDRLPGARTEVFLDHVLGQQLPADTIAPSADRGEAVRLLTAHAAKGLEWDVVVVAGVQEGVWPDLRLRGSLLGSERLVDVLAGRAGAGRGALVGADVRAARRGAAAVLRGGDPGPAAAAGDRGRVGAVGGADGEEQPSRFLHELAARTAAPSPAPDPAAPARTPRPGRPRPGPDDARPGRPGRPEPGPTTPAPATAGRPAARTARRRRRPVPPGPAAAAPARTGGAADRTHGRCRGRRVDRRRTGG